MNIIFKGSPNYGKRTKPVKKVVVHWFGAGTLESANNRFQNAANQVSAHYGISQGRVWQWVKESDVAWHSGVFTVNAESIGIEHDANPSRPLSEEDYKLSAELIREICKRHNLPINRQTIIGHKEVKATACPGTIDLDEIIKLASDSPLKTTFMKLTVVANNNNWTTLGPKLSQLNDWVKTYSDGKLEIVSDIKNTSYSDIPFHDWQTFQSVDVDWYRKNVTPYGTGQITMFLVNPEDWKAPTQGTMTWGDTGKPVRTEVTALENEGDVFVQRAFHEICHALYFLTGQKDKTHELLFQNPPKYKELLSSIDYQKLQEKLVTIKNDPMNQTKVVLGKDGKTLYEARPIAISLEEYKKQASVEGILIPSPIPPSSTL